MYEPLSLLASKPPEFSQQGLRVIFDGVLADGHTRALVDWGYDSTFGGSA